MTTEAETSGSGTDAEQATLDPDVLAELEREREFLLRSLDDLDAEYQAGDLDDHDHESLNDDYTRRLAEVIRSIENERAAFATVDGRLSRQQRVLTLVAVVGIAILAGVLLGRASGFRSPSDSVSGDIRRSSAGLLAEADTLTREGQWPEAIEVYNEVLALTPANAEALAYRGWLTARLGDPASGLPDVAEAVAVDDTFADARVFYAILLDDEQRFDEAAEQLAALDELDVPDEIRGLVESSNLRGTVTAGQISQRYGDAGQSVAVDLDALSGSLDDIAQAGNVLVEAGDVLLALKTYTAVLDEDPDHLVALVGSALIFGATAETADKGLEYFDRAIEIDAESPQLRLFRAQARLAAGDTGGARTDVESVDATTLPPFLTDLYSQLDAAT